MQYVTSVYIRPVYIRKQGQTVLHNNIMTKVISIIMRTTGRKLLNAYLECMIMSAMRKIAIAKYLIIACAI